MNKDKLMEAFNKQKEEGYKEFEYYIAHIIALKENLNEYDKSILEENYCRKDKIKGLTCCTLFYDNNINKDSYFKALYSIETEKIKYYGNGEYKDGTLSCKEINREAFLEGISNKEFIELLKYV